MIKMIRNRQKSVCKNDFNRGRIKDFLLVSVLLFGVLISMNFVSAITWDNIFYYPFNETSGTTATDVVNGTWDATWTGAPTYLLGKTELGGAANNDPSKYIDTGNQGLCDGDMSFSFWYSGTSTQAPMGTMSAGDNEGFKMEISGGSKIGFSLIQEDGVPTATNSYFTGVVDDGVWHHLVLTYEDSSGDWNLWINGSLDPTTVTGKCGQDGTTQLHILAERTGNALSNASIDEFGYWNRILTSLDVTDLWNNGDGLNFGGTGVSVTNININLSIPANDTAYSTTNITFYSFYNGTTINFTNASYYIWDSTGEQWNVSVNLEINGSHNSTSYDFKNISVGSYVWNVRACGTNSSTTHCEFAPNNYTFEIGASIDAEVYPLFAYETDSELFMANISIIAGSNLFAARLVYNGTKYLATKRSIGIDQYHLQREIDIPLHRDVGAKNVTFFWEFEYRNAITTIQQTTDVSHNVSQLQFQNCSDLTNVVVNFTVYNESNVVDINSTLDATFYYWLGTGTVKQNYSFDATTASTYYHFCSNINNATNYSATMYLNSDGYNQRTVSLNKESWSNETKPFHLYLHPAAKAIIVEVKDSGLAPIKGFFAKVLRYYPEDNQYRIIEHAETDEYGQFVSRMEEPNTVKYKFQFFNQDNVLQKETSDMTIACRTTICVIPFVLEDVTQDFDRFLNITGLDWSLSFDNSTNIFTLTWNDVTGEANQWYRLLVTRYLLNGTSHVCNQTSTSSAGTMTCDVGSTKASYQAQAFRSGSNRRFGFLSVKVGDLASIFGNEGLLWSFFLLMTMIAIGFWKPVVGISAYLVGITILGIIGIINMNPAIFIAQFVIGVLFIWAFKG